MTATEIFISYRRTDAGGHAGRLHERLAARFGRNAVFFDLESIEWGDEFPARIEQAVRDCEAFVAVMGPDWLAAADAAGRRRLDDEKDFVRREIALALATGKKLFVVAVGGARIPTAAELPPPLAPLAASDVAELGGKSFVYDAQVERLVQRLAAVPGVSRPSDRGRGARIAARLTRAARFAGVALLTALLVRAFLLGTLPDWAAAQPEAATGVAAAWGLVAGGTLEAALFLWRRRRLRLAGVPDA